MVFHLKKLLPQRRFFKPYTYPMDSFNTEPIEGAEELFSSIEQAGIDYDSAAWAIHNISYAINDIISAAVPIILSVALLAFFAYLLRYIFAVDGSPDARASMRGATRALIALFWMSNVWGIVRMLEIIADFSPATAYLIMLMTMLVFGFWSLFAIGETVIASISAVLKWVTEILLSALKAVIAGTALGSLLERSDPDATRLFVLVALVIGGFLLNIAVYL